MPPGRATPANEQAHYAVVAEAVERCVSLGRLDDALTLNAWLADLYVPRGDYLSRDTIVRSIAFYSDLGRDPALNERAITLLRRVVDVAPRNAGTEIEWATCKALMDLSTLHTISRTAHDIRNRTQASIDVCDEIIARWLTSQDSWLRSNVVGTMLNKAMSLLEFGNEPAARREYVRVIDSFAADRENAAIDDYLSVARHALDILDNVRFPEPEIKVRSGMGTGARRLVEAANHIHHATADLIRHATCVGEPWVLLLRNFDVMETSFVTASAPNPPSGWVDSADDPEAYTQVMHFTAGLGLINRLIEVTKVVQVANTKAVALEIDRPTMSLQDRRKAPGLLYLPDSSWLDHVRVLVGLAERIVVWAHEKTPALLQELALIIEQGRADETLVLLDNNLGRKIALAGFDPMPRHEPLTPEDPALAGFPTVIATDDLVGGPGLVTTIGRYDPDDVARILRNMRGEDPEESPILREIVGAISAAQQLPMEQRIARIRNRN